MFKPAKIERLPKMNFPYFIPHKGYQLTEDEVEAIAPKVLKRDKNILSTQTKAGISTLGAGSLAVLLGRAFPIEDYLYFTSHLLNLVLMILVLIIAFGIRIWISIGKKESVIKPSKKATKKSSISNIGFISFSCIILLCSEYQ